MGGGLGCGCGCCLGWASQFAKTVLPPDFLMAANSRIVRLLPPLPALPELFRVPDFRGFFRFLGPGKQFLQSYEYVITVLELHYI